MSVERCANFGDSAKIWKITPPKVHERRHAWTFHSRYYGSRDDWSPAAFDPVTFCESADSGPMHYRIWDIYLSLTWVFGTYLHYLWRKAVRRHAPVVKAGVRQESSIRVDTISEQLRSRPEGSVVKVDRTSRAQASNSMRLSSSTKARQETVRLGPANRILLIDADLCQVSVEPGVTMEQLVDALLPHKLVPFVVPEFKALTIGGVLAGAGIESSSWTHGQFGDSLIEAQYILSDGSIVKCSASQNSEFFYGALGACGTLGLLVSAKLRVQKIETEFVAVKYFEISVEKSIAGLNARMSVMRHDKKRLGMIDAIVYPNSTVIVTAEYNQTGPASQRFSRGRDHWFYQYVATRTRQSDTLHLKDYLFRYDAGAFWMSQYAISPLLDLQSVVHNFLPPITDPYTKKFLELIPFGGYNWLSRWLLSPLLNTATMYARLHQSPISDIADSLLIQDVYIPTSRADEFLSWLRIHLGAEKIWLCPMHESSTPQIFSPHHVSNSSDHRESFVNFGVWMHKASWRPGTSHARNATMHLERKVALLGGRKMLYSLSHYSEQEWQEIYDVKAYRQLKDKWDKDHAFGDIYRKVGKPA